MYVLTDLSHGVVWCKRDTVKEVLQWWIKFIDDYPVTRGKCDFVIVCMPEEVFPSDKKKKIK